MRVDRFAKTEREVMEMSGKKILKSEPEETKDDNNNANSEKPTDQSSSSIFIHLRVNNQDGNHLYFRIKRSMRLGKLMNMCCNKMSLDIKLKLEDGDEIDIMLEQFGA